MLLGGVGFGSSRPGGSSLFGGQSTSLPQTPTRHAAKGAVHSGATCLDIVSTRTTRRSEVCLLPGRCTRTTVRSVPGSLNGRQAARTTKRAHPPSPSRSLALSSRAQASYIGGSLDTHPDGQPFSIGRPAAQVSSARQLPSGPPPEMPGQRTARAHPSSPISRLLKSRGANQPLELDLLPASRASSLERRSTSLLGPPASAEIARRSRRSSRPEGPSPPFLQPTKIADLIESSLLTVVHDGAVELGQ